MAFRSTKGASKQRRDLINREVSQLKDLLPMSSSSRNRLSQLQVMAVISVYIRKTKLLASIVPDCLQGVHDEISASHFTQAIDGFMVAMTSKGQLLHISDNVTEYLGFTSIELMSHGDSIFDLIDIGDSTMLDNKLANNANNGEDVNFYLKMIVSKGYRRQSGLGEFKKLNVRGHFTNTAPGETPIFIGVFRPCMTSADNHSTLKTPYKSSISFKSVHSLDMKIQSMCEIGCHYLSIKHEMYNESWYNLIHPEDVLLAAEKHRQLLSSQNESAVNFSVRLLVNHMNMMSPNQYLSVSVLLTRATSDIDGACIVCTYELLPTGDRGATSDVATPASPASLSSSGGEDDSSSGEILPRPDVKAKLMEKINKRNAKRCARDYTLVFPTNCAVNQSYYTPLTPPSSVSSLNQPDSPNYVDYVLPLTPECQSTNLTDIQDTIDNADMYIKENIDCKYLLNHIEAIKNSGPPYKRGRYDNLDDVFDEINSLDESLIENEYFLFPTL